MSTKKLTEIALQTAKGATDDGVWYDVTGLNRMTVHITGITTATVQIMGSCAPTKPANATDGPLIGSAHTADALYEITAKIKWIKAKISAFTTGTISVYLVGDSKAYGV